MRDDDRPARRILTRREALRLMASSAAGFALAELPFARAEHNGSAACVARPQQIEGPYFVDERLNRSDIRWDPTTKTMTRGVPLYLTFRVGRIDGISCLPLPRAQVDVWHCDAEGLYSDTSEFQESTVGSKFLRGYQITDRQGVASFTTIFPGWYPGRTVHVHFKIRWGPTGRGEKEFTSQIYFDDALTDFVHKQPPYLSHGPRKVRNNRDVISLIGGSRLILPLREEKKGYAGTFDVGLQV